VAITSHNPFTLADVILSFTFADAPGQVFSAALGDFFTSFKSDRLRGISWGPDGRPGGDDDIVYDFNNPGPDSPPVSVNQLLFVGQGQVAFADPSDPRSDAEQFGEYLAVLEAYSPYTFTNTYSLRGVSSTVKVEVEPKRKGTRPPFPYRPIRPFRLFPIR
jgi:hypothetical protein